MPGLYSNHEFLCAFVDPNCIVRADLMTLAWSSAPDNDFVILRYVMRNLTTSALSGLYIGLYLDFDINYSSAWYDRATWDSANEWGYMWDNRSPATHPAYVGLVGITDVSRGSVVHNPTYVYPSGGGLGWADTVKYNFLAGAFSSYTSGSNDVWSLIIADGPFSLALGATDTFVYAIVAGDNLSDFTTNAGRARTKLNAALFADDMPANTPGKFNMTASPNPFNSSCRIELFAGDAEEIRIDIIDLTGRIASTMTHAGSGEIVWHPGDEISSGLYVARATFGEKSVVRKLLLMR